MAENILLDYLPETVKVDGREYKIDTNFRTSIIFEKILDEVSDNSEKVYQIIDLFYIDESPKNIAGAIQAVIDFYTCGEKPKENKLQKNGAVEIKPKMIYSFDYDAPYIFAAFLTQYKIDLNDIEYMHWWKFKALFRGLEDHNKIVEIMGYRATDLGKVKNKEERERIANMKRIYAIPQKLSFEEKVAAAGMAFCGGAF